MLRVERAVIVHMDGSQAVGPPKTEAGRRTVAVPANVVRVLAEHVAAHVGPERAAWLFASASGDGPISARTLSRAWERARTAVGRSDLHLHDLRHSGLTWAAGPAPPRPS